MFPCIIFRDINGEIRPGEHLQLQRGINARARRPGPQHLSIQEAIDRISINQRPLVFEGYFTGKGNHRQTTNYQTGI